MSECEWFNPEIFMCCVVKGELTYCERDGCTKFEPTQKCQSCLKEHDRELKEALEHRITICDKNLCKFSDSCKGFYGFRNCKIKDEFWKERGI